MPGIFGLVSNKIDVKLQLNNMAVNLKSDCSKINEQWVNSTNEVGFGRVGLGIYQSDNQPVMLDNRVIFLEGEIVNRNILIDTLNKYSYEKNSFSDAGLVLALYNKIGCDTFKFLNGSFAIAIWEMETNKLILASDYAGLRPFFYFHKGKQFCFAPEIKAILSLGWYSPRVESRALMDILAFGFPQDNLTLFENVYRLQPGFILMHQNGHNQVYESYQIRFKPENTNFSDEEHQEQIAMLLERSLQLRCKPDLKPGLTLSGGLDTRVLLAVCHHLNLNLPTFTYGQKTSKDRKLAKKSASAVGAEHFSFELDINYVKRNATIVLDRCEGRVSSFLSHGVFLNKMKFHSNVMLLGNGGEYLFGIGRDYYSKLFEIIPDQPYETYFKFRNSFFKEEDWSKLLQDKLYTYKDHPREHLFYLLNAFDPENIDNAIDSYRFNIVQMNRTLQGLYLVNHVMEFSEPYLDRDLVLWASSLPFHLRRKRKMHNYLLKKYNPKLARINGGPDFKQEPIQKFFEKNSRRVIRRLVKYKLLDKKFIARPSSTFTDLHYLIRNSHTREWIKGVLLNKDARIHEFVKPAFVQKIVDQHMADNENHTTRIDTLMTLELFLQQYIT